MTCSTTVEELLAIVKSGGADPQAPGGRAHIFDLRDGAAYQDGHIPGSRHLPLESVLRWAPQRVSTLELIVLVDDDGALGGPARRAAAKLAHKWFTRVRFRADHRGIRPVYRCEAACRLRTARSPTHPQRRGACPPRRRLPRDAVGA